MVKTKKSRLKYFLYLLLGVLVLGLIVVSAIDFNVISNFYKFFKEPHLVPLKDECSLIMNQLIHKIRTEGDCKISCSNQCNFRKESFSKSVFAKNLTSCNTCMCYCK